MTVIKYRGEMPYSDDFLTTMKDDLEQLAIDVKKAGGEKAYIDALLNAARVIRIIRAENEAGE